METSAITFASDYLLLWPGVAMLIAAMGWNVGLHIKRRRINHEYKEWQQEQIHQRELLLIAIKAEENERRRIARLILDDVGTMLSAAKHQIHQLHQTSQQEVPPRERVEAHLELLNIIIHNTREISRDLMPAMLENLGLSDSLQALCSQVSKSTKIEVEYSLRGGSRRLEAFAEVSLYRAVQELVRNSVKHASASRIVVELSLLPDRLCLRVTDNGCGISSVDTDALAAPSRGSGLKYIKGRMQLLCGRFELQRLQAGGTQATIELPLSLLRLG